MPLYFIAREARKHVKVVLSGEGADELFGGYNIYREPLSLAAFDEAARRASAGRWAQLSTQLPDGMRGKDLLRRGSIPLEQRYYGNARIFRDDELGFLRAPRPGPLARGGHRASSTERTRAAGYDDVTAMQYVDLFTWLRGDILVKADKMTMANSLELRVPFLDPEVFKVAGTLPVDQRVTKETTKYALRRALEQIVPPHVLNRRKLGFPVPDPALAGRAAARLGAADHRGEPDRRVAGQAAGPGDAGRAPGQPAQRLAGRLLAQALDAAGLHDLARHLRRGADHARRSPRRSTPSGSERRR